MTESMQLWENGPLFLQTEHARLTGDSVLLADFAQPYATGFGSDLGCASGVLMLILLWQNPSLRMAGMELNRQAVELAEENFRLNGLKDRAAALCVDFCGRDLPIRAGSCDFVICNPPYFEKGSSVSATDQDRAAAREERTCSLEEVCRTASRLCRSGGRFFLCSRPDRMAELLRVLSDAKLEPKRLRFVHHRLNARASLVLTEARRDGKPGLELMPPLILTTETGSETPEYRQIYKRI